MPATNSGPRMDEALYHAYLGTDFRIDTQLPQAVRIGKPAHEFAAWMRAQGYRRAMLITAWNPYSVPVPRPENDRRQQALEAEVELLGIKCLPAHGADPGGKWEEASLCLFDVSPEQRDAWMRRYEQNAVVLVDAEGDVRLFWHPDLHSHDGA